jgi:hypothetical protein
MLPFTLLPFDRSHLPPIEINGAIEWRDRVLEIEYVISGDLTSIAIPAPKVVPERKFDLWEATCCELFVAIPDRLDYWEVNLSPSGDWNVFHLDDYRQGLVEEVKIVNLPIAISHQPDRFSLKTQIDLPLPIGDNRAIEVGITTVIATPTKEISYWALTHSGQEADFHLRASFSLVGSEEGWNLRD